jgi:hypothetical protein
MTNSSIKSTNKSSYGTPKKLRKTNLNQIRNSIKKTLRAKLKEKLILSNKKMLKNLKIRWKKILQNRGSTNPSIKNQKILRKSNKRSHRVQDL